MNQLFSLTKQKFDESRAEHFAQRISDVIDAGALCMMLSLGHRSGLLDTMAQLPPSTSDEIAAAARLDERYVREWLASMVTGRVIDYEAGEKTYFLSAEHAASITREGSLGNIGLYSQHVAMLALVQDRLLECFRSGAGMHYADYPCFHQIMAEDSSLNVLSGLFADVLPLMPGIEARLEQGMDVLDAGCGRGLAISTLAQRYPRSRFVGYDLCGDAIDFAQEHANSLGLSNIQFIQRDLSDYNDREQFDLIMSFDAVHDQRDPQQLISSLYEALRSGGCYLMQDIGGSAYLQNNLDFPLATMLYAISCSHCMPVSLGQNGAGLGTMWGWETAAAMLAEAGFASIDRSVLPHDPTNVWFVSTKA